MSVQHLKSIAQQRDAGLGLPALHSQLAFDTPADGLIRLQGMSVGLRNEPVDIFLGNSQIAFPDRHRHRPDERNAQRNRVIEGFRFFDGLSCDHCRTIWVAFKPKRPG